MYKRSRNIDLKVRNTYIIPQSIHWHTQVDNTRQLICTTQQTSPNVFFRESFNAAQLASHESFWPLYYYYYKLMKEGRSNIRQQPLLGRQVERRRSSHATILALFLCQFLKISVVLQLNQYYYIAHSLLPMCIVHIFKKST